MLGYTALVSLLILLAVFFLVVFLLGAAVRRTRRTVEETFSPPASRVGDGRSGPAPAGADPFGIGGLLGDLLSSGTWSTTYTIDPETGQWVEVGGSREPAVDQPAPDPAREGADGRDDAADARRRRRAQRRQRATPQNPLAGLLGGGMAGGGLGGGGDFDVEPPEELETFEEVGGMEQLKQEVRDTVGLMLQHPDDAERYGIEWNGILLHGPPGVGKTFFARAIAGEYRLNLMHVSTGDLVSSLVGGSAQNIDKAFDTALRNLPCLLFFDEFDSVAQRREGTPDQESRRTVNQMLTSLEAHRDERELLVMAATNSIEHLDPAVIRPGRFDRHIRIDLPDAEARRAIFLAELKDRPATRGLDLEELVRRTEGMTPAAIEKVVDMAALDVFKQAAQSGDQLELDTPHLLAAIERYGGQDRPTVERWNWDSLILPPETKAQLRQLQSVIEDPESALRFGVDPPTGLLLAGPPGTGKTTVAKVLAAQARASFYPVSGADVMSKWVGESEQNISRLFDRARENRPSIVFIDEIDAIAPRRGQMHVHDSQVNQLLSEIDGIAGQQGVFVIGATNRPDQLDPALLRGGRLSRTIVLGVPDETGRLAILRLYTARMPTVNVRLDELAAATEGWSPADLKALTQEAALAAMTRTGSADAAPAVTHEDFLQALEHLGETRRSPAGSVV